MSTVLEGPELDAVAGDPHAFNLAVWDKIVADPEFARMAYRFETNGHGQILMSPPPAPNHGRFQIDVGDLLKKHAPPGTVASECPISTRDGVRAADVVWCSEDVWKDSEGKSCLLRCPEICVEVLSPSNTPGEIDEKITLYFATGASEVWLCSEAGEMIFLVAGEKASASAICPEFPCVLD